MKETEHRIANRNDATKDLIENYDDEGMDVKVEVSNVSDKESNTKVDGETEQQLNHELVPNVLDDDKNLIAEADDKIKAKLTNDSIKTEADKTWVFSVKLH